MKIHLIAIGTRMPDWVNAGFQTYAKRLPHEFSLHLIEIPAGKRLKNANLTQLMTQEGQQLLAAVPKGDTLIALDRQGQVLSTTTLAQQFHQWHSQQRNVSLLIGGPEGLATACLQQAAHVWSLSPLTLPHALVRILIAEQIYRVWSIITHHPYHR